MVDWQNVGGTLSLVSGYVVLLLIILPTLMEVFHICRCKTNFLARLFIYLAVTSTVVSTYHTIHFGSEIALPNLGEICRMFSLLAAVALYYVLLLELLLIFFLNMNLFVKTPRYHSDNLLIKSKRPLLSTLSHHLLCAVTSAVTVLTAYKLNIGVIEETTKINVPALTDSVLCLISMVILVAWFFRLRRKEKLKEKLKLVCVQIGLVFTFWVLFLIPWTFRAAMLNIYEEHTSSTSDFLNIMFEVFPSTHAIASVPFLAYLCVTVIFSRPTEDSLGL